MASKTKTKKKVVQTTPKGQVHIFATFNNIIVTITNLDGTRKISSSSAGQMGFKGSKKATPYAATKAVEYCAQKAVACGMKHANVSIKGTGPGRESAIIAVGRAGIIVDQIKDITPIPHNGCRPPKIRKP